MIKFNRGPMSGKRQMIPDGMAERLRVREPLPTDWSAPYPASNMMFRQGEYIRSHNKLKNGTVIYEWIGWLP